MIILFSPIFLCLNTLLLLYLYSLGYEESPEPATLTIVFIFAFITLLLAFILKALKKPLRHHHPHRPVGRIRLDQRIGRYPHSHRSTRILLRVRVALPRRIRLHRPHRPPPASKKRNLTPFTNITVSSPTTSRANPKPGDTVSYPNITITQKASYI